MFAPFAVRLRYSIDFRERLCVELKPFNIVAYLCFWCYFELFWSISLLAIFSQKPEQKLEILECQDSISISSQYHTDSQLILEKNHCRDRELADVEVL